MTALPRILFGDHRTQMPAIERMMDRDRFDVAFSPFDPAPDFAAFDLVVPLRIDQIAPARAANADGRRRAVLPDDATIEACDDKLLFHERLEALGLGELLPAVLGDGERRYPHVLKARRGDWGQGICILRSPADEPDEVPTDSFREAAVEGADEYVLHLLRVDGRVRYRLCYRYDMGAGLTVRGAVDAPRTIEPADDAPALEPCLAILDALGFEGTCCFNYKLVDGRPVILELNSRFGGSLVGDVTNYVAAHLAALGQ
jgi:carbamoylphosphate synthase large subunit